MIVNESVLEQLHLFCQTELSGEGAAAIFRSGLVTEQIFEKSSCVPHADSCEKFV